jgi:hypothetical protein
MPINLTKPPRPLVEDYLRSFGYLNLMAWSVLFFLFPPSAFLSGIAEISRLLWLSVAFVGAGMAFVGAIARIDIKLEFPGILLAIVGPAFYALSQLYLTVFPPESDALPGQRIALVAYAFLGVTLLLPRAISLLVEKNRLKDLGK